MLGAVSALVASLLALSIPLVLEVLVQGPIAAGATLGYCVFSGRSL